VSGKTFSVQVKGDSLVWSLGYVQNAKNIVDLAERVNRGSKGPFLDAQTDTRVLEELRLCDVAFPKLNKNEVRKRLDGTDDFTPSLYSPSWSLLWL